ncbi:MAG: NUDIX hydrolase [Magnetococcales bacterium]|nr:NUDIX hydrolase [Magnetococcales bacterium]
MKEPTGNPGGFDTGKLVRPTVSVHALIIDQASGGEGQGPQLLMTRLAYRDHRWRKWSFPGGYVDQGEGLPIALKREIQEEVGIDILASEQVEVVTCLEQDKPHIGFLFRCDAWQGEPRALSREVLEILWMDEAEFGRAVTGETLAYPQMVQQVAAAMGWGPWDVPSCS